MVIGDIHETANPLLRKALAGLKKVDDACSVLKYDPLIIAYGNMLACKFQTSDHHGRQIRAQMRLLGRLVLTLKSLDSDIDHLGALYHPAKFDVLVRATYILGKFDKGTLILKSPATARDIGHLVKEVKKLWVLECTEKNQDHLIDDAKKFMRSFKAKFSILIGTTIAESQTQMNIVKGAVVLPKLDDIRKLNAYLIESRRKAYASLKKEFQVSIWKQLAEFTLVSILLLNRRRPGELQRMKLVHYEAIEKIDGGHNREVYSQLSDTDKNIAQKYSRIMLRGKKNKKISPVLIDDEMEACINLLIHHRRSAKVSRMNPYVFAMPSEIEEESKKSLEIVPLLSKYAKACGAEIPHALKSVELRKHIATVGIEMQLSNSEVEALSGFMGHDVAIHKGIYRQRLPVNDIVQMSKLLEKAQGLYVETESGESRFVDEDEDSDIDPDGNKNCASTSASNTEWNDILNNSVQPRGKKMYYYFF
ncbi:hypothetical protein RI129_000266 [Pyrocoelia pectoralis]|uniref:Uncharacterized protein n=1 Tax=Pyrocoelia pectoralis TaxID=417401 RepID=A0AAN7ZNR8_9COLE